MNFNLIPVVLVVMMLALFLPAPVSAADLGIFYGDTIPAGVEVNHDLVLFGENVLIEGTVNGNVFILDDHLMVTSAGIGAAWLTLRSSKQASADIEAMTTNQPGRKTNKT